MKRDRSQVDFIKSYLPRTWDWQARRFYKKKLPLAHIHYISDHKNFVCHIVRLSGRLCWRMKVAGLMLDERLLQGGKVSPSMYLKLPYPRVYKSDTLKKEEVDLLYSEYQVLNL